MASVDVRSAYKSFGKVSVLKGVDVHADDGEMMVLVGPSGCGKSTLLRAIAGLEELNAGQIGIGGRIVTHLAPRQRDVAMVFQNYALYPQMSVRDNMGFSLRLAGIPVADIAQRVATAADLLGLQNLLERLPKQLSGGQRQRVAMGRAIVRDPQVFLFDEPLSNLDAHLRVTMRAEIKALHQRLGTTMLYVTHDQIEAMTMADRIVVLRDGQVEQIGRPLDLYDRPANAFVASFIGSPAMNLLPGRLSGGAAMQVIADDGVGMLPVACAGEPQEVLVGVRPEHLQLQSDGPLRCQVEVVEPTGPQTHLIVRCGIRLLTAVTAQRLAVRPGDSLRLGYDVANVHTFSAASGARM